ncbi:hypothetical protein KHA80_20595 [Anaerobacillus sp. HL2]|nr:hypothetical protein KHA80_20595 [Anaerobacillus sp. HL2]
MNYIIQLFLRLHTQEARVGELRALTWVDDFTSRKLYFRKTAYDVVV